MNPPPVAESPVIPPKGAARAASGPLKESPHPDLHEFVHGARRLEERTCPSRTLELAVSLRAHVAADEGVPPRLAGSVEERIVTDELLRSEADRDQNVYLGRLFTKRFTHAMPDLVFLPGHVSEVSLALQWARKQEVPVTIRGAGSAALGGAVPHDGGLTLDLSRLDHIDVDARDEVCVIGAGARQREIHVRLAARGLALPVYSSNLGGTFAGWLVGGGVGLNAFGPRRALDVVRAVELVLPSGELVRLHADGRLDVPSEDRLFQGHRQLAADQAEAWFAARELRPFGLADLPGSEGIFGVVVQIVVSVGLRPQIGALLLGFGSRDDACAAALEIAARAGADLPRPVNLKLVDGAWLRQQHVVWAMDDARGWTRLPSSLSAGEGMPWTRIAGPDELCGNEGTAASGGTPQEPQACLYVDFLDLDAAVRFAARLHELPGHPVVLPESTRVARERFRPQQSKRLGPGMLAAEIELPATQVAPFLKRAARVARGAGVELDPEVYYLSASEALVIAGYLTDHRRAAYLSDLALAPALLSLAVKKFAGRPYVLGRWQSWFAAARFGAGGLERRQALKATLDPQTLVNRGVVLGPSLLGTMGRLTQRTYPAGVGAARVAWSTPGLSLAARGVRGGLRAFGGPARGRGEPAVAGRPAPAPPARALHCVNCGECNAVCPAYDGALVRLPQTLTHLGERLYKGRRLPASSGAFLDLCFACGNCEEVCQAAIPHLELYADLRAAAAAGARHGSVDAVRQRAILEQVRASERYRDEFLDVRPGQYQRRTPASLSGTLRYFVERAENEAGPAATCWHCAACVPVCPTGANKEYERLDDARRVTTDEYACVGCGTCVEVCPSNRANGGQTLRVVEVPTPAWLAALGEFEAPSPSGNQYREDA